MSDVHIHFHFPPGDPALFQQILDQGKTIMTEIETLQAKFDEMAASNAALKDAVTAARADVAESVGLMQQVSVAALVLKDAYDAIKNALNGGGTPEQLQALITKADALLADQASALAVAQDAKAALDATDASQTALPGQLQP